MADERSHLEQNNIFMKQILLDVIGNSVLPFKKSRTMKNERKGEKEYVEKLLTGSCRTGEQQGTMVEENKVFQTVGRKAVSVPIKHKHKERDHFKKNYTNKGNDSVKSNVKRQINGAKHLSGDKSHKGECCRKISPSGHLKWRQENAHTGEHSSKFKPTVSTAKQNGKMHSEWAFTVSSKLNRKDQFSTNADDQSYKVQHQAQIDRKNAKLLEVLTEKNVHETSKSDKNVHTCKYCKKRFPTINEMKLHKCKKSHVGLGGKEKRYKCTYCTKVFENVKIRKLYEVKHTAYTAHASPKQHSKSVGKDTRVKQSSVHSVTNGMSSHNSKTFGKFIADKRNKHSEEQRRMSVSKDKIKAKHSSVRSVTHMTNGKSHLSSKKSEKLTSDKKSNKLQNSSLMKTSAVGLKQCEMQQSMSVRKGAIKEKQYSVHRLTNGKLHHSSKKSGTLISGKKNNKQQNGSFIKSNAIGLIHSEKQQIMSVGKNSITNGKSSNHSKTSGKHFSETKNKHNEEHQRMSVSKGNIKEKHSSAHSVPNGKSSHNFQKSGMLNLDKKNNKLQNSSSMKTCVGLKHSEKQQGLIVSKDNFKKKQASVHGITNGKSHHNSEKSGKLISGSKGNNKVQQNSSLVEAVAVGLKPNKKQQSMFVSKDSTKEKSSSVHGVTNGKSHHNLGKCGKPISDKKSNTLQTSSLTETGPEGLTHGKGQQSMSIGENNIKKNHSPAHSVTNGESHVNSEMRGKLISGRKENNKLQHSSFKETCLAGLKNSENQESMSLSKVSIKEKHSPVHSLINGKVHHNSKKPDMLISDKKNNKLQNTSLTETGSVSLNHSEEQRSMPVGNDNMKEKHSLVRSVTNEKSSHNLYKSDDHISERTNNKIQNNNLKKAGPKHFKISSIPSPEMKLKVVLSQIDIEKELQKCENCKTSFRHVGEKTSNQTCEKSRLCQHCSRAFANKKDKESFSSHRLMKGHGLQHSRNTVENHELAKLKKTVEKRKHESTHSKDIVEMHTSIKHVKFASMPKPHVKFASLPKSPEKIQNGRHCRNAYISKHDKACQICFDAKTTR